MQGSAAVNLRRMPRRGRRKSPSRQAVRPHSSSGTRINYVAPVSDSRRITPLSVESSSAHPNESAQVSPIALDRPSETLWPPPRRTGITRVAQQFPFNKRLQQIHQVYGQYIGPIQQMPPESPRRQIDMRPRGVLLRGSLFVLPSNVTPTRTQLPPAAGARPHTASGYPEPRPRSTTAPSRAQKLRQPAGQPAARQNESLQAWPAPMDDSPREDDTF